MRVRLNKTTHTCCTVAATAHSKPDFVVFLQVRRGIVVCSVEVFLVLNWCLRTVQLISVFKKSALRVYQNHGSLYVHPMFAEN